MSNGNFYTPREVAPLMEEIVPAYQSAFAGDPWYEVSKCADVRRRCIGGLSSLAVGQLCNVCDKRPERPAYETEELIGRFESIAIDRPVDWYVENFNERIAVAAIAWSATADKIAQEKYADVPEMREWLFELLGDEEFAWLDDIFANSEVRPKGNLRNFGSMCSGFMDRLGVDMLAYRTINPRMVAAAKRDFADRAIIFERERDVPDRRDFILIKKESKETI